MNTAAIVNLPPMSPEEEDAAIPLAQRGNTSARRRVSTAYLHLVWQIASELCGLNRLDEAISEGTLGVFKALQAFDPSRDRPFAAYVPDFIRGQIKAWLRAEQGTRRVGSGRGAPQTYETDETVSLDAPLSGPDSETGTLHDILPDSKPLPEDIYIGRSMRARVTDALGALTPSERCVLRARSAVDEPTLADVAREQGYTRERARKLEAKAIRKLRAALAA